MADGSGVSLRIRQRLHSCNTRKMLLVLFLAYVGCFIIVKYHVFWISKPEVAVDFNNELQDMALAIKEEASIRIITMLKTWEFQSVRIFNVDKPALINLVDESLKGNVADAGIVIYFPLAKPELVEQANRVFGTDRIRVSTTEDANGLRFYKITFQSEQLDSLENRAILFAASLRGLPRIAPNRVNQSNSNLSV